MQQCLTSNGMAIPYTGRYFGTLRATDWRREARECVRQRFADDGYVFLPQFLSAESVLALRRAFAELYELREGSSLSSQRSAAAHGLHGHAAYLFVRGPLFDAFVDAPELAAVAEQLLGDRVHVLRRRPLRHFVGGSQLASRAHVDRSYLDERTHDFVSVWIPLGDCPMSAGGIVYLENSHARQRRDTTALRSAGDRPHDERVISHDLRAVADAFASRWLGADFSAGDVVVHAPDIVHASLDAQPGTVRLSTDVRFIRAGMPADPRWNAAWSADDGY